MNYEKQIQTLHSRQEHPFLNYILTFIIKVWRSVPELRWQTLVNLFSPDYPNFTMKKLYNQKKILHLVAFGRVACNVGIQQNKISKLKASYRNARLIALLSISMISIEDTKAQWCRYESNARITTAPRVGDDSFWDYSFESGGAEYRAAMRWSLASNNCALTETMSACTLIGEVRSETANSNDLYDNAQSSNGSGKTFLTTPLRTASQGFDFFSHYFEDDGEYNSSAEDGGGEDGNYAQKMSFNFLETLPSNNAFQAVPSQYSAQQSAHWTDNDDCLQCTWHYVIDYSTDPIILLSECPNEIVQTYGTATNARIPSWAVQLTAGTKYRFSTCGSSFDTYLSLFGSNGYNLLNYNDDACGMQSILEFICPETGVYFLDLTKYTVGNSRNAFTEAFEIHMTAVDVQPPTGLFSAQYYCELSDVPPINPSPTIAILFDNCDPSPTLTYVSETIEDFSFPQVIFRTYYATDYSSNAATIYESIKVGNLGYLLEGGIIQNPDGTLSTQAFMESVNTNAIEVALHYVSYHYQWIDCSDNNAIVQDGGGIFSIPPGLENHQFSLSCDFMGVCTNNTPCWSANPDITPPSGIIDYSVVCALPSTDVLPTIIDLVDDQTPTSDIQITWIEDSPGSSFAPLFYVRTWRLMDNTNNYTDIQQVMEVPNIEGLLAGGIQNIDGVLRLAVTPDPSFEANYAYQWYDCATNNPINGANSSTFTPTGPGNYKVFCTYNGGLDCSGMSDCFDFVTSIEEVVGTFFTIYPNPNNSNELNIDYSGKVQHVNIYNLLGDLLITTNLIGNKTIDISVLAAGEYLVKMSSANSELTQKLIVTR